ncbi:MAG TPA: LPXTG cell wall anchor domain-containing protein [Draconibacterium sp.]|nr:LPXTG cell wall anchor domain-containing protein [Draconibacterium sp.]
MKRIIALIGLFLMSLPTLLMAQEEGTYIENLGAQDSSYLQDPVSAAEPASSSNNTVVIVIVVVVIIAVAAFFLLRKKKK